MKTDALIFMDRAKQELAKITTIDEAKTIRDKAETLRIYAKKIGKGLEIQNQCAEIKIRAERKAGELIHDKGRKPGETDKKIISHDVILSKPKLNELGISLMQSSRWQCIASISEDLFEQFITEIKESTKELTSLKTIEFAKKLEKDGYYKDIEEKGKNIILPDDISIVIGDFREKLLLEPEESVDLIFTDPPYDKEHISLYGDMAKIAKDILKPGASLLAYCGHYAIPEILNLMTPYLKFWWIICIRHTGSIVRLQGKWVFVKWKPILWFVKDKRRDNKCLDDLFESSPPPKKEHSWSQDLSEAEYYIKKLTFPGDLVLDPCCGAATTLIASHKNKRFSKGIEIDSKFIARAKYRINNYLKEIRKE